MLLLPAVVLHGAHPRRKPLYRRHRVCARVPSRWYLCFSLKRRLNVHDDDDGDDNDDANTHKQRAKENGKKYKN